MECRGCYGVSESQEKMSGMSGVFVVLTSPTKITKSITSLLTSSKRMSDIRSGCYAKGASLTNLKQTFGLLGLSFSQECQDHKNHKPD